MAGPVSDIVCQRSESNGAGAALRARPASLRLSEGPLAFPSLALCWRNCCCIDAPPTPHAAQPPRLQCSQAAAAATSSQLSAEDRLQITELCYRFDHLINTVYLLGLSCCWGFQQRPAPLLPDVAQRAASASHCRRFSTPTRSTTRQP